MSDPPRLLTTREVARALGVDMKTVQRWVREGLVTPALRLPSGQMRWNLDDLRAQLDRAYEARSDDE